MTTCTIDGCERTVRARKLCTTHHSRWLRGGTTELRGRQRGTEADRFWAKVDKTETCWLWTAATARGYGQFKVAGDRLVGAHRWSYEAANGPVPEGLHLDHLCRVTRCVNPSHLEAVTPKENMRRGLSPTMVASLTNICLRGHSLADAVIAHRSDGRVSRWCRTCEQQRRGYAEDHPLEARAAGFSSSRLARITQEAS